MRQLKSQVGAAQMSRKYSLDGTEFVFFPLPFPPSSVQLLEIHSLKSAEHLDLYSVKAKSCLEPHGCEMTSAFGIRAVENVSQD